jgi:hypothetical protein
MGAMAKTNQISAADMASDDNDERRKKRRKFNKTLRHIMREEQPLTNYQMAAMFDDDGDLGTAMRQMLLSGQ